MGTGSGGVCAREGLWIGECSDGGWLGWGMCTGGSVDR
jgi:hypothetical protein